MKISVDISLYPLTDDYIPAIKAFIDRISEYDDVVLVSNDLSTQLFGDYDRIMEVLGIELKRSWQTYGKGVFVVKYLLGDVRQRTD